MKIIFSFLSLIICNLVFSQVANDSITIQKLFNDFNKERFDISNSYKIVPKFIKKAINKSEGKKFRAANKGCKFNSTDINIKRSLRNNRILYIAYSDKFFIITYERGGFGRSTHSKIIKYSNNDIFYIINLVIPLHENIDDLKNILMKEKDVRFSVGFNSP